MIFTNIYNKKQHFDSFELFGRCIETLFSLSKIKFTISEIASSTRYPSESPKKYGLLIFFNNSVNSFSLNSSFPTNKLLENIIKGFF